MEKGGFVSEPVVHEFTGESEWLDFRRNHLTATDAAAILGLDEYRTAAHVYAEKVGALQRPATNAMKRGRHAEKALFSWYAEDTGYQVVPLGFRAEVHPSLTFLMATRDANAITSFGDVRSVEGKTANFRARDQWGEAGTDEIPRKYIVQIQVQAHISGIHQTDVPAFVGDFDSFRIYHVPYRADVAEMIVERLRQFYVNHIEAHVPPDFDFEHDATTDLVKQIYTTVENRSVELSDEYLELVREWERAKRAKTEAEKRADRLRAEILAAMTGASVAKFSNGSYLTAKEVLKAPYTVQPKPYVDLRFKGDKE